MDTGLWRKICVLNGNEEDAPEVLKKAYMVCNMLSSDGWAVNDM